MHALLMASDSFRAELEDALSVAEYKEASGVVVGRPVTSRNFVMKAVFRDVAKATDARVILDAVVTSTWLQDMAARKPIVCEPLGLADRVVAGFDAGLSDAEGVALGSLRGHFRFIGGCELVVAVAHANCNDC